MSVALEVWVEGIGVFAPGLADWPQTRAFLRGERPRDAAQAVRPPATALAAGERRRAPASVRQAVEVADQAVRMADLDPARLPCVFASAHGDVPIMDEMCATLARAAEELSPTSFHNSVHNAAAGYWTIASGCRAPSTALSAHRYSFAAGLLEAACQAIAGETRVLLVASDVAGVGPLSEVIASTEPFACALVLAPRPSAAALCRLRLSQGADPSPQSLAGVNPAAASLPLLGAIARGEAAGIMVPAAPGRGLDIQLELPP